MWEKILTEDALEHMITFNKEETEDMETMSKFVEHLIANVDYKVVVVLATQWHGLKDTVQANVAIEAVDEEHASRFIILMDYLSEKFQKGELK